MFGTISNAMQMIQQLWQTAEGYLPNPKTVHSAYRFTSAARMLGLTTTSISPDPDGAVTIAVRSPGGSAEVVAENDGTYTVIAASDHSVTARSELALPAAIMAASGSGTVEWSGFGGYLTASSTPVLEDLQVMPLHRSAQAYHLFSTNASWGAVYPFANICTVTTHRSPEASWHIGASPTVPLGRGGSQLGLFSNPPRKATRATTT